MSGQFGRVPPGRRPASSRPSFQVFRAVVIEPIRWIVQSPLLQQILHSRLFTLVVPLRRQAADLDRRRLVAASAGRDATGGPRSGTARVDLSGGQSAVELAARDAPSRKWSPMDRAGLAPLRPAADHRPVLVRRRRVPAHRGDHRTADVHASTNGFASAAAKAGAALVAKAALGLLWFFVAYVLRFAVNVLIEPQINPIKHFPGGHRRPQAAAAALQAVRRPAGSRHGHEHVRGMARRHRRSIWCIPGIFGFLVWELKENWRLYAANRRPRPAARARSARTARPWPGC